MMRCAMAYFKTAYGNEDNVVLLAEITLNNLAGDGNFNTRDFLDRAEILCSLGYTVMVSNCHKHDVLVNYLDRCKPASMGIILGILNVVELFNEKYYKNAAGELLHYFGEIFSRNAKMLVYPYQSERDKTVITTRNLQVPAGLRFLYQHLVSNGFLVDLTGYNAGVLQIFSTKVIKMIQTGEHGWEEMVPDTVADMVKQKKLFDYMEPVEVKS
jgi:hypothetical protein